MLTTDDPLDLVNRVQVIEITDKLNGLLPTIGLSQFPTLDARFRQLIRIQEPIIQWSWDRLSLSYD